MCLIDLSKRSFNLSTNREYFVKINIYISLSLEWSITNKFISFTKSIYCLSYYTSFISLQWMVVIVYKLITANTERSLEQQIIIIFILTLNGYSYYLNNVKSFYIWLLTSRRFRKRFLKAFERLLSRKICFF
jgi:hypothetical protein